MRTLRGDTALSRLTAVLAVAGVLLVAVAALLLSRGTPARVEGPTQALDPAGSPTVAASPSSRSFGPPLVSSGPRHRLPDRFVARASLLAHRGDEQLRGVLPQRGCR